MTTPAVQALGDKCCGCAACASICPKECISMKSDGLGFPYPEINVERCIGCGACDCVCPTQHCGSRDATHTAYWAMSKSDDLLVNSSSGGLFGVLARVVIQDGGAVYGAAFTDDYLMVRHCRIDSEGEIRKLQKSKYVQSIIEPALYDLIVSDLTSDRMVLFSGTACQVSAVNSFVRKKKVPTDRLLLIEVFCHGVPSPALWRKWAVYRASAGGLLSSVDFRDKSTGWASYSVVYGVSDRIERINHSDDWYMKAFLANASLRPSCFCCNCKRMCSSDITLGDYWGIENCHPELTVDKGISAVLVNTDKGQDVFQRIAEFVEFGLTDEKRVAASNPSLVCPALPYKHYSQFTADVESDIEMDAILAKWPFPRKRGLRNRLTGFIARHRR